MIHKIYKHLDSYTPWVAGLPLSKPVCWYSLLISSFLDPNGNVPEGRENPRDFL